MTHFGTWTRDGGGGSMEDIARDGGCTGTLRDEFPPRDRMLRVPVS